MEENNLIYDVAISFAGEDRKIARKLATSLNDRNIQVFYDEYEQHKIWGKDLYTYLSDIYQNKSKYCIMLVSKNYSDKVWTKHERAAAQARAINENKEYILPIRLDNTVIPGLLPTIAYIDWNNGESLNMIISSIEFKLKKTTSKTLPKLKTKRDHPVNWQELDITFVETFDLIQLVKDVDNHNYYRKWLPYNDGKWEASLEEGNFVLQNLTDPSAVKYHWISIEEEKEGQHEMIVSIEVRLESKEGCIPITSCGLLLGFEHDTKFYFACTVSERGMFYFFKRDENGFNIIYSGRLEEASEKAYNKVGALIEGKNFFLYLNDNFVKRIEVEQVFLGVTGIVAIGEGKFYFDNLTFYE